jgi:hypothetical protein
VTQPARSPGVVALRLLVLAGLLAMAGVALLGIPGALWLAVASPLAGLFTDRQAGADAGWPMAIVQTLAWPFGLPLAYLGAAGWRSPGRRLAVTLAGTATLALLLAVALQISAGRV